MGKGKILLLVGCAFLALVLCVGGGVAAYFLLSGSSKLGDVASQKAFLADAETALSEKETFAFTAEGTDASGEAMSIEAKIKGDDYSMNIEQAGQTMGVVVIGEDVYLNFGGGWAKMDKTNGESFTSEFSGLTEEFSGDIFDISDSDWDNENIKYIGLEKKDGVQCQKFSLNNADVNGFIWIDAKSKLVHALESDLDGETMTATFTYTNVNIEAPSDYEDLTGLSEEEAGMKLLELMGGGY